MTKNKEFISRRQLLNYLGVSHATLYRWEDKGTAPPRYKLGGSLIAYRISEIDDWVNKQVSNRVSKSKTA